MTDYRARIKHLRQISLAERAPRPVSAGSKAIVAARTVREEAIQAAGLLRIVCPPAGFRQHHQHTDECRALRATFRRAHIKEAEASRLYEEQRVAALKPRDRQDYERRMASIEAGLERYRRGEPRQWRVVPHPVLKHNERVEVDADGVIEAQFTGSRHIPG